MRDIELKKRLISLIESRDLVASAGKLYTADPEHAVISRGEAFLEYVAECKSNSINPHIDSRFLAKWAKADLIDINNIPESERSGAIDSISNSRKVLHDLGLAGYQILGTPEISGPPIDGDESADMPSGFSAYGAIVQGDEAGFIAGIPVKPAADGLDSSVDYSAYNNGSGAQSDGGVRQKKNNTAEGDIFSIVSGVVSSAPGKDGIKIYSIDGKPAFYEHQDKVVPAKEMVDDENALLAATLLASKKFGGSITINGDEKFVGRVMQVIAKNGIDIKFTDPAQANFYLGVASSVVRKVSEPESPLDAASKKSSFADRMTDIAAYGASMATGGVVSAEKIKSVTDAIETAAETGVKAAKKLNPGPTFH